jgi:hypothetical protein
VFKHDEEWRHWPKLKMDGSPRVEGGRASIGKPTYPRKTHKQKTKIKYNLKSPKGKAHPF